MTISDLTRESLRWWSISRHGVRGAEFARKVSAYVVNELIPQMISESDETLAFHLRKESRSISEVRAADLKIKVFGRDRNDVRKSTGVASAVVMSLRHSIPPMSGHKGARRNWFEAVEREKANVDVR